jgi:hypothetical protein
MLLVLGMLALLIAAALLIGAFSTSGNAIVLVFPAFVLLAVGIGMTTSGLRSRRAARRAASGTVDAISEKARPGKGGVALLLFGLLFLAIGSAFFAFLFIMPAWRIILAQEWSTTQATILSSGVVDHRSSDGTTYSVAIKYRYVVNGTTYESDRYNFNGFTSSSGRAGKEAIVQQYPAGSIAFCYFDPHVPREAVLDRGFSPAMLLGLFPLIFVFVGGGIMYAGVRAIRSSRRPKRIAARHDSIDEAADEHVDGDPWPVFLPRPSQRGTLGATTLRPSSSRLLKLAILGVFTLIFGAVAVYLAYETFDGHAKGRPEWGLTLMAVIFSLVVMGLASGCVYTFLALFNPTASIEVDSEIFVLGSTVNLSWQLTGNINRIKHLRVFLRGEEQTTYRRGTRTYTDKATFAEIDVLDAVEPQRMQAGRTSIRVPADLMHSFAATHNRVIWHLCVRGEIPRWPDMADDYDIILAPVAVDREVR